MAMNVLLHRKYEKIVSSNISLTSKPLRTIIDPDDRTVLSSIGVLLEEECNVVYYTKLMLKRREICTRKSKETRRNNSCVRALVNVDGTQTCTYGLLHKLLVIPGERCFAIINVCPPSSIKLCSDDVTKAKLHKHLLVLNNPRCDISL